MSALDSTYRRTWLERLAPLGGIVFALAVLFSFFRGDEYDDTPESVVAYAESSQFDLWLTAIMGLATPLLLGLFVAALVSRVAAAEPFLRALIVVGGSVFIALVAVGLTIWSAPLLDDDISAETASTYLALDDFGWVILGTGGVGAGVMIIAASLAAARLGLVRSWLGWVGVALGVVAFASAAAVGLFAWVAFLLGAGTLMLLFGDRGGAVPARD